MFSYLFMPIIIVVFTGLLVLLYDVLAVNVRKEHLLFISLAGLIISTLYSAILWGLPFSFMKGMLVSDNFSIIFSVFFLLSSAFILLISYTYLNDNNLNVGEYYALVLFATAGMMFMASTFNLIVLYLGLELLTLPLAILICFKKGRDFSHEASLKFFILSVFSSAFFLFGIAFMFGAAGTINIAQVAGDFSTHAVISLPYLLISAGLLILGLGFKISSVPFHIWTPDVYHGAPTPVTAFLSAGAKVAGFAALIRIFFYLFPGIHLSLTEVFIVLSVITMTLGNIVAIAQRNIKRMLAYSSIAHSGYVLMVLTVFTPASISSAIFYLMVYVIANLGAFGIVLALRQKDREYIDIMHFSGLAWKRPLLAGFMAIFMLSLAGVPPTAGFMGKFYLFSVTVKNGFTGLVIAGLINSVLAAYYYLRIVYLMYMKEEKENVPVTLFPSLGVSLFILGIAAIYFGIFPSPIISLFKTTLFH
ncbi:MAG: NADH-quinone oxidoreductase subunit N [Candidatus Omnitrophica bacterium]|nr:NADH-quinone oxidoreductase subunit N [Candidatus Omnitrophota bacterium]